MKNNKPSEFASPAPSGFAFSGRGFLPDIFSESGFAQLNEASRSTLEFGVVPGKEGMLPPPAYLRPIDPGKRSKEGESGGAGSFYTSHAFER